MERVTVSKQELINIITQNRTKHKAAYTDACIGYQRAAVAELQKHIETIQRDPTHRVMITEFPPTDHSDDYDKALRMLAMSVEDKVQITSQEFTRFIDDDWDWKKAWVTTTSKYATR